MKKMLMTMVALLTMTAAVAQQSDKKERRAPRQLTPEAVTSRMAKDLQLNDQQTAQLSALNKEYQDVLGRPGMGRGPRGPRPDGQTGATPQQDRQAKQKQGERRERPQLTDEQKAQLKQQQEKRKEYDAKLKQILTDDQYKAYQKQQNHRGGRGPGHDGPRGHRPDRAPQD